MENSRIKRGEYFADYKRTDTLVKKKIIRYLPVNMPFLMGSLTERHMSFT